jgi:hypothetical protein
MSFSASSPRFQGGGKPKAIGAYIPKKKHGVIGTHTFPKERLGSMLPSLSLFITPPSL